MNYESIAQSQVGGQQHKDLAHYLNLIAHSTAPPYMQDGVPRASIISFKNSGHNKRDQDIGQPDLKVSKANLETRLSPTGVSVTNDEMKEG